MAKQPRAQLNVDPVGGVGQDVGAQAAQHDLKQGHDRQAQGQHLEGRQTPVHEHLVDDHLEEQRREQGKELNEEGADQDLGQRLTVLLDRVQEPGDAETAARVAQRGAAHDQDQVAAPAVGKDLGAHGLGRRGGRVLHQHLAIADAADHQPAAVAHLSQGRKRRAGQPLHRAGD